MFAHIAVVAKDLETLWVTVLLKVEIHIYATPANSGETKAMVRPVIIYMV